MTRHFYEDAYERSQERLRQDPAAMTRRMSIVERPFAVLKQVMGLRRFSCRGLMGAKSEMAIAILGYHLMQMVQRLGVGRMLGLMA